MFKSFPLISCFLIKDVWAVQFQLTVSVKKSTKKANINIKKFIVQIRLEKTKQQIIWHLMAHAAQYLGCSFK